MNFVVSEQIKMVVQEKDNGFLSGGYSKQEWKEILNGTPEDRRTHVYVWPSAKASMEPMRIIK